MTSQPPLRMQVMKNRKHPLAILTALLLTPLAAAQSAEPSPIQGTSHVIVPHSREAARNGEASLIELRDGSLLLMYGAHQKGGDWDRGEIRQIRSRDGGKTWSEPATVFHDEHRSLFQVAFARLANGDLGLTHTSLANGRDAFKVFRRSTDEGKTWSEPLKISDDSHEYTTGPWDKLYVLASGRVIALLHCNLKPDAKKQGGPLGSYTVNSDDNGKTWTRSPSNEVLHVAENPTKKHEWGFWEPSLVETAPGKLLMLGRTTTGWLWESRSEDNGSTWSRPVQSTVANPVAPAVLTRVPGTETLVLIHNPDVKLSDSWHGGARLRLAYRTSHDGGHTWSSAEDIFRAPDAKLWVDYPAARWIKNELHLVWRHIENPATAASRTSLYHHVIPRETLEARPDPKKSPESNAKPLRIMPLGDSITRGSYLAQKDGKATGLPDPRSGGWRKVLQDKLRAAGIAYDFVGEVNCAAFGRDGVVDPNFDPDHHGLAGFGNTAILKGGAVPTPADVLASLGVKEIKVPGIVDVLKKQQPDVILLMSGANGFDAAARDTLIRTIGDNSTAHLFVATTLPQQAPRAGWEKVDAYNASLPAIVAAQQAAGKRITLVDMHAALTTDDLLPDGVHPNQTGMDKMAATWFAALTASPKEAPTPLSPQPTSRQ
jgi:lysophospholipase L1-like esterase